MHTATNAGAVDDNGSSRWLDLCTIAAGGSRTDALRCLVQLYQLYRDMEAAEASQSTCPCETFASTLALVRTHGEDHPQQEQTLARLCVRMLPRFRRVWKAARESLGLVLEKEGKKEGKKERRVRSALLVALDFDSDVCVYDSSIIIIIIISSSSYKSILQCIDKQPASQPATLIGFLLSLFPKSGKKMLSPQAPSRR